MIKELQIRLLQYLPAWEAHKIMAPPSRGDAPTIPSNVKRAAVCIILFLKDNEWHTILMQRTEDGHTHGGQISFPGGRHEQNDFSFTYTALRECEEEIGIASEQLEILGSMSSLYIPPSNFLITPILCYAKELPQLKLSPTEVVYEIILPLTTIFNSKTEVEVRQSDKKNIAMIAPAYVPKENCVIWGATAMLLSELNFIFN